MPGVAREVLRWLQSLDLQYKLHNPKWDLSNGFLVAEVLYWYYPEEVQLHSFYTQAESLEVKERNWNLIKLFVKSHRLDVPSELLDGTLHRKEGAAMLLVERLFEILTNRRVRKIPVPLAHDFGDDVYQSTLPLHARHNVNTSLKSNVKITELKQEQNTLKHHTKLGTYEQKAQRIITHHLEDRYQHRLNNPERFDIKPSLAERCPRKESADQESVRPSAAALASKPSGPQKQPCQIVTVSQSIQSI